MPLTHKFKSVPPLRLVVAILFLLMIPSKLRAQEAMSWEVFTDKKIVNSAIMTSGGIWAGGAGGAFFFNTADSSYRQFTKADGLNESAITAVAADRAGKIWMGFANGAICVIDPAGGRIKSIYDILNTTYTQKQINSFSLSGDTLFISTDFGLSLINTTNYSFIDTYLKFGSLTTGIKVLSAFKQGRMFLATSEGIVVQKSGAVNLNAPESWNVYTTVGADPIVTPKKFSVFENNIIVSTQKGFLRFSNESWQYDVLPLVYLNVNDFLIYGDSLYVLHSDNKIFSYKGGNANLLGDFTSITPRSFVTKIDGGFILTSNKGIAVLKNGTARYLVPDGPAANRIYSMTTDSRGNLWVATGKDDYGKGLFRYNRNYWTVFDVLNSPLKNNDVVSVCAGSDGNVYAGTWGFGFVRLKNDSLMTVFDGKNTPVIGIVADTLNYIVVTGLGMDSKGGLWLSNYWSSGKQCLSVLTKDSLWYNYSNPIDINQIKYTNVVIDYSNTKWFTSIDDTRQGLFYFNENNTYAKTTDDRYGYVSGTGDLSGKSINALAVDQRGELWVGTSLGVYVLYDPSTVLASVPNIKFNSIFSLRQYTVNAIAVDAINRKWIGTNQGLLLVSPDGTTVLDYFSVANSPLLSDKVTSLAVDQKYGTVYVGTALGINAIHTVAIQPNPDLSQLLVYPNPVLLNEGITVTFDGLIKDSEIKILDISGNEVRTIATPGGGRAFWDGKDNQGTLIASGVYLAIVYDKDGTTISTTKIAAIKK